MKLLKPILLAIVVGTVAASNCAWADRGHWGGGGGGHWGGGGHFAGHGHFHRHAFGVFLGAPFFYPWYWPDPYPYPYYTYSSPTVYVEQGDLASGYWYHCNNPSGYYPTVKECPGGWTKVAPTPPR